MKASEIQGGAYSPGLTEEKMGGREKAILDARVEKSEVPGVYQKLAPGYDL
jgi:hypothetical protein